MNGEYYTNLLNQFNDYLITKTMFPISKLKGVTRRKDKSYYYGAHRGLH